MVARAGDPHRIQDELGGAEEYQAPPREHEQEEMTSSPPTAATIRSTSRFSRLSSSERDCRHPRPWTPGRTHRQSLSPAKTSWATPMTRTRCRRARGCSQNRRWSKAQRDRVQEHQEPS